MVERPYFTVLMPTSGREDVIGHAIGSILAQTETDFELLVVGDGCTDGTEARVRSVGDPRLRWLGYDKAPGPGYGNRNHALHEARGEVVAFAQHDDLIFPDHLKIMRQLFRRTTAMWAYSRPLWIDDDGFIIPFFVNLSVPAARNAFMRQRNVIPSNCVAARRDALLAVGGFDSLAERAGDWALWKAVIERYGPNSIAFARTPTSLHFRALWKEGGKPWGPPPLSHMAAMARFSPQWPRALKLGLEPGVPPQARVAAMLEADTAGIVARIRAATANLQDHFAWIASFNPLESGGG